MYFRLGSHIGYLTRLFTIIFERCLGFWCFWQKRMWFVNSYLGSILRCFCEVGQEQPVSLRPVNHVGFFTRFFIITFERSLGIWCVWKKFTLLVIYSYPKSTLRYQKYRSWLRTTSVFWAWQSYMLSYSFFIIIFERSLGFRRLTKYLSLT